MSSALARAMQDAKAEGKLLKAVVNFYGQSVKMDELIEICDEYGVSMIEDAAESLGSLYKGKKNGTYGKYGIYSFHGNKIITTSGGGALVSDDGWFSSLPIFSYSSKDAAKHY